MQATDCLQRRQRTRKVNHNRRRQVLDILTRVSPPQTDSLTKNQRTDKLEDLGNKNFKSDFEDKLKSQMKKDQNKIDPKEKPKPLQAEQNESQSGEIKKRIAKKSDQEIDQQDKNEEPSDITESEQRTEKFDPTMISMNMVSIENEVEIPDENENLAMIEESSSQLPQNVVSAQTEQGSAVLPQPMEPALEQQLMPPPLGLEAAALETAAITEQASEIQTSTVELAQPTDLVESTAESLPNQTAVPVAPTDFQQKVMDALKNEKMTLSDEKLGQLQENLATTEDVTLDSKPKGSFDHPSSEKSFDQESSTDLKSSGEQSEMKDQRPADSMHVGQSEFGAQLSAKGIHQSGDADKVSTAMQNDTDPSVKELLNQANYLVTKGGGEVTLKMNAVDGMGEVHLKVMMDNGKMNIELNTQDKSVKKLIEDSLSDLRSSLASRQISLEHVKINSVNATSTENNSQSMQNNSSSSGSESNQSKTFAQLQQQMQQQSQQHQWRQQGQNNFARNNFDLERPVALPMVNVQKSIAKNYYGLSKGNSLNAVA